MSDFYFEEVLKMLSKYCLANVIELNNQNSFLTILKFSTNTVKENTKIKQKKTGFGLEKIQLNRI